MTRIPAGPKITLLAMPLMARSGVYRSTHELVRAATELGEEWSAVVGMRVGASGEPLNTPGVREVALNTHGPRVIAEIQQVIEQSPEVGRADIVVTLISQSDIAMSRSKARQDKTWVAWVRGKPWPARGEQNIARQALLRYVEARALRRADDVWATTPVLASEFASVRSAKIVPAGIAPIKRIAHGENADGPLVWAGRVDIDKRPELFVELVRLTGHPGRLFGEGPLRSSLELGSPPQLEWSGWSPAAELWHGASLFIGSSSREAFGRSAVEAASAGLPVLLGANYGAAPLLFTSADLAEICVISSPDPRVWATAVRRVLGDDQLRREISSHVHANAKALTIQASVSFATKLASRVS